jgi:hypothetical protein
MMLGRRVQLSIARRVSCASGIDVRTAGKRQLCAVSGVEMFGHKQFVLKSLSTQKLPSFEPTRKRASRLLHP